MNEDPNISQNQLEVDTRNANLKLALAKTIPDFDDVLNLLESLIERAPQSREVLQLAENLADKAKVQGSADYVPQIKVFYRKHNVPFREKDAEVYRDQMQQGRDSRNLEVVEETYKDYKARGYVDPVVEARYRDAQEQKNKPTMPFEILTKFNRARSTSRVGDFKSCIELCDEALEELNIRNLPDTLELGKLREEAQYNLDRRQRLDEGLKFILEGRWDDAKRVLIEASKSFKDDDMIQSELNNLQNTLNEETHLDREIRSLRAVPQDVPKLLELSNELVNLPSKLNANEPTDRQKRSTDILEKIKRDMVTSFRTTGERNLRLSESAATVDESQDYLKKAREYLDLVLEIDKTDAQANSLIEQAIRNIQIQEKTKAANALRAERTASNLRMLRRIVTLGTAIIIIVAVFFGVKTVIDNNNTQNEAYQLTQVAANQTAVQSINNETATANSIQFTQLAITAQYESTERAIQAQHDFSTATAQQASIEQTATRNQTDLQLTLARETASAADAQVQATQGAAQTQTQIIQSNLETRQSATLEANLTESARLQAQQAATGTISAFQTQTASAPTATPLYKCQGIVTITVGVKARALPNANSSDMGGIPRDALVDIFDYSAANSGEAVRGWYQVIYRDGAGTVVSGWVGADYLATFGCPADFGQ